MIVVRNVMQIDPVRMKEAREAAKAMLAEMKRSGLPGGRVLADLTGESYTLVIESEIADLGAYERVQAEVFASAEWQKLYAPLRAAIRGGRRDIYRVVD
jgi:hypothetical protein